MRYLKTAVWFVTDDGHCLLVEAGMFLRNCGGLTWFFYSSRGFLFSWEAFLSCSIHLKTCLDVKKNNVKPVWVMQHETSVFSSNHSFSPTGTWILLKKLANEILYKKWSYKNEMEQVQVRKVLLQGKSQRIVAELRSLTVFMKMRRKSFQIICHDSFMLKLTDTVLQLSYDKDWMKWVSGYQVSIMFGWNFLITENAETQNDLRWLDIKQKQCRTDAYVLMKS